MFTSGFTSALQNHLHENYPAHEPGAALLVQWNGKTIFAGASGMANLETCEPLTPESNFRLASVSKQFTAMGVALLAQSGKLNFGDKLIKFFPQLPQSTKDITLRHLLTHTSGLPDYEDFVPESRMEQVTDQEVLEIAAAQRELLFKPGTQLRYSNTGFVLLGLVIEKVAEQPFRTYMQESIFGRLGMESSTVYSPKADIKNRALGYAPASNSFSLADQGTCTATQGDGCLYSSVQEYTLWDQALDKRPEFSLETLLQKVSAPIDGFKNGRYGMGWFFAERQDGTFEMYHTGNTSGFSNLVIRVPSQGFLLACFSNRADNPKLIPDLVELVQQNNLVRLESDLIWALPHLTR